METTKVIKKVDLIGKNVRIVDIVPDPPSKFEGKVKLYIIEENGERCAFYGGTALDKLGIKTNDVIRLQTRKNSKGLEYYHADILKA